MHPALLQALDHSSGLICLNQAPTLRSLVRRAVTAGELAAVLPGIYAPELVTLTHQQRALAIQALDPAAVLIRGSAAFVQGWIDQEPTMCCAATHRRLRRMGFHLERRSIPAIDVIERNGLRTTTPELTTLDLARTAGGAPIDNALRLGIRLEDLWETLERQPASRGTAELRRLLQESRDRPWSPAERAAHRALRGAHIGGWEANVRLFIAGRVLYPDLAFCAQRLIVEIDGRTYHDGWAQRVNDLGRDRLLTAAGWRVIRFPASLVLESPQQFVREVAAALQAPQGAVA